MAVQTLAAVPETPVEVQTMTAAAERTIRRLTAISIGVAMAALSIGITIGVLQGMEHAGFNAYPYIYPALKSYYQGLTLHGVLNALIWTTFFIVGFFTYAITHSLNRPLRFPWVN